jgi:TolA-binding protein
VVDEKSAATGSAPDYRGAIARYGDYLKAHPKDPGNHRVLYQLARAHEQGGDPEAALKTLDRLVADYPSAPSLDEAQFRRGELLFTARRHADAERAYAAVLKAEPASLYQERALFMHGWSLFKQGRLEESLHSFFGVLERKLGADPTGSREALTRADRELLEDTFRVTSLALQNLQGAASIPAYVDTPRRAAFEPEVYRHLGEMYLKQERIKDAADSFAGFARVRPMHAQAPVFLSRVIEIHEGHGFATLALQAKKDYVARYGLDSEFRRANPDVWQAAQPFVKTHLAELARHHHALAQKSRSAGDVTEAVRWYRAWLVSFPDAPEAAQSRFLLAELLFRRLGLTARLRFLPQGCIASEHKTRRLYRAYEGSNPPTELVDRVLFDDHGSQP